MKGNYFYMQKWAHPTYVLSFSGYLESSHNYFGVTYRLFIFVTDNQILYIDYIRCAIPEESIIPFFHSRTEFFFL